MSCFPWMFCRCRSQHRSLQRRRGGRRAERNSLARCEVRTLVSTLCWLFSGAECQILWSPSMIVLQLQPLPDSPTSDGTMLPVLDCPCMPAVDSVLSVLAITAPALSLGSILIHIFAILSPIPVTLVQDNIPPLLFSFSHCMVYATITLPARMTKRSPYTLFSALLF